MDLWELTPGFSKLTLRVAEHRLPGHPQVLWSQTWYFHIYCRVCMKAGGRKWRCLWRLPPITLFWLCCHFPFLSMQTPSVFPGTLRQWLRGDWSQFEELTMTLTVRSSSVSTHYTRVEWRKLFILSGDSRGLPGTEEVSDADSGLPVGGCQGGEDPSHMGASWLTFTLEVRNSALNWVFIF